PTAAAAPAAGRAPAAAPAPGVRRPARPAAQVSCPPGRPGQPTAGSLFPRRLGVSAAVPGGQVFTAGASACNLRGTAQLSEPVAALTTPPAAGPTTSRPHACENALTDETIGESMAPAASA